MDKRGLALKTGVGLANLCGRTLTQHPRGHEPSTQDRSPSFASTWGPIVGSLRQTLKADSCFSTSAGCWRLIKHLIVPLPPPQNQSSVLKPRHFSVLHLGRRKALYIGCTSSPPPNPWKDLANIIQLAVKSLTLSRVCFNLKVNFENSVFHLYNDVKLPLSLKCASDGGKWQGCQGAKVCWCHLSSSARLWYMELLRWISLP